MIVETKVLAVESWKAVPKAARKNVAQKTLKGGVCFDILIRDLQNLFKTGYQGRDKPRPSKHAPQVASQLPAPVHLLNLHKLAQIRQ